MRFFWRTALKIYVIGKILFQFEMFPFFMSTFIRFLNNFVRNWYFSDGEIRELLPLGGSGHLIKNNKEKK